MAKAQNIYKYKPPKSGNDEVSYFLTKGRITRKAFFFRLLLVAILYSCSYLIHYQYFIKNKNEIVKNIIDDSTFETVAPNFAIQFKISEQFQIFFLIVLCIFLLIQGAKRMHDVDKSGWCFFIQFYNIALLFSHGTIGQNKYGIDPRPRKVVKYFDELKKEK